MLTIGYYLAGVQGGLASGGVAPYATRVLENLLEQPGSCAYHLFVRPSQVAYARELQRRFPNRALSWSRVRVVSPLLRLMRPLELMSALGKRGALRALAQSLNHVEWQTGRQHVDLMHSPIPHLDAVHWRTPTIITVHDVQELHFPEFFTPDERFYRAGLFWWAIEAATKIVVSFAHVKADLLRYFRLPPEKVCVCPIPVTGGWLPQAGSDICARYGIEPGFLFYPAQTWPHKNHIGLLRALAYLRDTSGLTPTLVCTGKQNDHFAAIKAEIEALGLQKQVRFLGLVSSEDLVGLYRTCRSVVVPTLYEAGSFPVIEALMLEVPVICSRVTSLPETIGAPEFTFDPGEPVDIAQAIRLILCDESYYRRNLDNGARRRAEFANTPWQSAEAFTALYASLVKG